MFRFSPDDSTARAIARETQVARFQCICQLKIRPHYH